ncbi:MAG: Xaa-Pro peptidase family protein [Candidatus Bathyarchaeota archaeon]|nr:Xaa-Pro peptidase family protein [Candidatus Bathyarchaeota archaeon]
MADYRRRLEGLQAKMEDRELDLLVLGASPDFQYLTDSRVEWRRGRDLTYPADAVFVPRDGDPIILAGMGSAGKAKESWIKDVRGLGMFEDPAPAVKEIVMELAGEPGKVGVGEYTWSSLFMSLATACKGAKFRKAEGLLDDLRMIKEPEEIETLRKAATLTENVMTRIIDQIQEGDTMRGTGLKIETMGRMIGASDVSFPSTAGFCKSGSEETDEVFNYGREQGLEQGTSIAFDVGFVVDGYCSDWGRSFYYGKAHDHFKAAYVALQTAVVETIDAMGDTVTKTNEVFPKIEEVCDRMGYGDYLRERLASGMVGHQIGVEVHEDPWLKPDQNQELVDGMVFCVEPKLWMKGEFYLRVEDMVLIKNGKAESLTTYDRERFEL